MRSILLHRHCSKLFYKYKCSEYNLHKAVLIGVIQFKEYCRHDGERQ